MVVAARSMPEVSFFFIASARAVWAVCKFVRTVASAVAELVKMLVACCC